MIKDTSDRLHMLQLKLHSGEPLDRLHALERIVALDCHGLDCSSIYSSTVSVSNHLHHDYVRSRRLVGVLSEKYFKCCNDPSIQSKVICSIVDDFEKGTNLIQGIAVRQAGRIITAATADKLIQVIVKGASSHDPYVRRASACSISNIFQSNPSLFKTHGLISILQNLITDSNPNVIANALSSIMEVYEERPEFLQKIEDHENKQPSCCNQFLNIQQVSNILAVIEDATEWSQIQILDFISLFEPENENEARGLIARVIPRLSHSNSGVVISALKFCLVMNHYVNDEAKMRANLNRAVLPMITLMNYSVEVQYISTKAILIILQTFHNVVSGDINIFFCKYDDPLYLKLTKLEILLNSINTSNVGKIIDEIIEYALQTDIEFARKSVKALGRICINFENAAQYCVDKFIYLLETKNQHLIQEIIIVACDIFRRYPGQYEGIIPKLCLNLTDNLEDHQSKSAMMWIIGQYANLIGNVPEIINALFLDNFIEENSDVQLSILTSIVKFYLINPEQAEPILQKVIHMATLCINNPDVRDRAFFYLRLLENDLQVADSIISPQDIPIIKINSFSANDQIAKELVPYVGTLSSIYGKLPQEFITEKIFLKKKSYRKSSFDETHHTQRNTGETDSIIIKKPTQDMADSNSQSDNEQFVIDEEKLPTLLRINGLIKIDGSFQKISNIINMILNITNFDQNHYIILKQVVFQHNLFGLVPGNFDNDQKIDEHCSLTITVPIIFDKTHVEKTTSEPIIKVSLLTNMNIPITFICNLNLDIVMQKLSEESIKTKIKQKWDNIKDDQAISENVRNSRIDSIEIAKNVLQKSYFFLSNKVNEDVAIFNGYTIKDDLIMLKLEFQKNNNTIILSMKSNNIQITSVISELVKKCFI